ncbi:MAG: hypothetical protein IJA69_04475 [Clostridia bacterium]|nr:hypothetical protein [Clostridia bacterium]
MLKNIGKFNDIKLAKGLNIQTFRFARLENYQTARNSQFYADYWYDLPKGRALYKPFSYPHPAYEISNVRVYNEMICQQLLTDLNLPHAHYEPAHEQHFTGLVSYNMIKQNEVLISLDDFLAKIDIGLDPSILECRHAVNAYIKRGVKIDKKKFLLSLYALSVFDTLTLQTDRNDTNICIIHNPEKNEMRLAPIFDNEYAFGALSHFNLFKDEAEFEEIINDAQKRSVLLGMKYLKRHNPQKIDENVKNLVHYAHKNKDMMKVLNHILNNIDIVMAIEKVENMGYEADDEYKEYIQEVLAYTTNKFKTELEKINNIENKQTQSDVELEL